MPSPIDDALRLYGSLALRVEALTKLSVDRSASLEERRTAALTACEILHGAGVFQRIAELRAWIEKNKTILDRAIKMAGAISGFRG